MQPCLPLASSMMPWGIRSQVRVNEPLLQLVNALFWFCVMSGSVETLPRLGGKLCMRLIAKVIRISRAKFPWNRLTTVCTRYSRLRESHFWDTLYCKTIDQRSGSVVIKKNSKKIFVFVVPKWLLCRRRYEKIAIFNQYLASSRKPTNADTECAVSSER